MIFVKSAITFYDKNSYIAVKLQWLFCKQVVPAINKVILKQNGWESR